MQTLKIQIEIDEREDRQNQSKSILCTECGESYESASAHVDIRCANCGNHQNPI